MKKIFLGYGLYFLSLIFFSMNGVGGRFLVTDSGLSFGTVTFLRFFGAVLLLSLFILLFIKKGEFNKLLNSGILKDKIFWIPGIFLFFTILLFNFGLQYTSASNGVLIQSLFPIVITLGVLFYYPGRKHSYNHRIVFFVVVFSSVGTSLLLSDNSFISSDSNYKLFGDFLAFLSMLFYAIFNFFNCELRRKYDNYNGLLITTLFLFVALLLSTPAIFFINDSLYNLQSSGIIFAIILSFGTGICYLSLFFAARYLNIITIALLFNIVGITTVIFEYFFYGKSHNPITFKLILGGLIITSSIVYINYLISKDKNKE